MAKIRASRINFSVGGTALEASISSLSLEINQPEIDVTSLGDTGPRSLIDNYRSGYSLDGHNDFASGGIDSVLFALVGDEDGAATIFQPTGAGAGASDPNYTGSDVLTNYTITGRVGGAVDYSARLSGSTARTRAVA